MAANTVATSAFPRPPMPYSTTKAIDDATTEASPAANVATRTVVHPLGMTLTRSRKTPQPTRPVTTAMLRTFAPSAETPPSANNRDCTITTTPTAVMPSQGPTRITARAPPKRWPEVPAATGKFNIWSANTKAATRPVSAILLSWR